MKETVSTVVHDQAASWAMHNASALQEERV